MPLSNDKWRVTRWSGHPRHVWKDAFTGDHDACRAFYQFCEKHLRAGGIRWIDPDGVVRHETLWAARSPRER